MGNKCITPVEPYKESLSKNPVCACEEDEAIDYEVSVKESIRQFDFCLWRVYLITLVGSVVLFLNAEILLKDDLNSFLSSMLTLNGVFAGFSIAAKSQVEEHTESSSVDISRSIFETYRLNILIQLSVCTAVLSILGYIKVLGDSPIYLAVLISSGLVTLFCMGKATGEVKFIMK